jgi:malonyl-CoA O-methyltransferase
MVLHGVVDPPALFARWHRLLAVDGFVAFSCLGPGTLAGLRELYAALGWPAPTPGFIDMHDLGDMLVAAGFAAPVMDMEMLDIAYRDPASLLADLRASGQTSARADRSRGLTGRRYGEALRAKLAPKATFEVVYGHAWKGGRKHPDVESAPKTVRVFKRMP